MKRHLSYSNVVATIALIFAVGGGTAIAATVVTGKQIKNGSIGTKDLSSKARKALKGAKGSKGAAGARGAAGAAGAAGARGANGGNGARGSSSWDPIPSGQLVTGAERFDVEAARANSDFSFPIHLPGIAPAEIENDDVNFAPNGSATDDDPACSGTPEAPTAPAGKMCLYFETGNGESFEGFSMTTAFGRRRAARVVWFKAAANSDSLVEFTWAYRAP